MFFFSLGFSLLSIPILGMGINSGYFRQSAAYVFNFHVMFEELNRFLITMEIFNAYVLTSKNN